MGDAARLRVAFQGELGAFSEEALQQLYGGDADPVPLRDFADVVQAVMAGIADRAVLPIENTIVGSVARAHDALESSGGLHAVGETVVAVHHCLLVAPGATMATVRDVFSHPVALMQCARFFKANPELNIHEVYDTAGAAADVAKVQDPALAAVASRGAARHYGLEILRSDIEDRPDNQTRFVAFAPSPLTLPAGTPARTMVSLTVGDAPAALLEALTPLARHGVSVRRMDSRPAGEPWTYRFFIEFDHQAEDPVRDAVIEEMARTARTFRLLGTFPRWGAGRRNSIGWKSGSIPVI